MKVNRTDIGHPYSLYSYVLGEGQHDLHFMLQLVFLTSCTLLILMDQIILGRTVQSECVTKIDCILSLVQSDLYFMVH